MRKKAVIHEVGFKADNATVAAMMPHGGGGAGHLAEPTSHTHTTHFVSGGIFFEKSLVLVHRIYILLLFVVDFFIFR
jgi:hypothetical protein